MARARILQTRRQGLQRTCAVRFRWAFRFLGNEHGNWARSIGLLRDAAPFALVYLRLLVVQEPFGGAGAATAFDDVFFAEFLELFEGTQPLVPSLMPAH